MQLLGRQKGSGSASGSSSSQENSTVNPTAQEEVLEKRLELLQSQLDLAQGLLVDQSNKSFEAHWLRNNADRRNGTQLLYIDSNNVLYILYYVEETQISFVDHLQRKRSKKPLSDDSNTSEM